MIKLTRLDGSEIHINSDLIETIEETPDTHISLTNGNRFLVKEKASAILDKIVNLKARIRFRSNTCRKEKYLKKARLRSYSPARDKDIDSL